MICAGDDAWVVGRHRDGGAGVGQHPDAVQHLLDGDRVEFGGRLVGDEERRASHHRAGDGDALLLTVGQPVRSVVQAILQPEPAEHLQDVVVGHSLAAQPGGKPRLVGGRQVLDQVLDRGRRRCARSRGV
jgi:hypothetical protein